MPHFVILPNLPNSRVAVVAVGEDYAAIISTALEPFGIIALSCPKNSLLDSRLSSHIDLSLFHLGGEAFVLAKSLIGSSFSDKLTQMGAKICYSASDISPKYPSDAFLCALTNGSKLFHNEDICDPLINSCYVEKLIHVNQGYAKCSACLINENAAISSDSGIIKAMREQGMDVLEISSCGIQLQGFAHGFIGGAAFKISADELAFTGTINDHPSKADILGFLKLHNIKPVFLTDKPIFDIGSAIPLTEI
ncbi:MAG: hypothetical protein EOM51_08845 [Clostridia bacterium]|nr:hypothetical protein [Clostridia bacterium]